MKKGRVRYPYDPMLFYMMPGSYFFSEENDGGVVSGLCTIEDCVGKGCMPNKCKWRKEIERWLGVSIDDLIST